MSGTPSAGLERQAHVDVMGQLNVLINAIEEAVQLDRTPVLELKAVKLDSTFSAKLQRVSRSDSKMTIKSYKFGTRTFEVLLAVISYVYEALTRQLTVTKRDIYYRDVLLFKSQAVVDDALQRLTSHLGIQRHQLNVGAAAKGLVRGDLRIKLTNGSIVDCRCTDVLIDRVDEYEHIEVGLCDVILVLEKEAVFHSLVACSFHGSPDFNCIMITGKGYPDLNTRKFLCRLERTLELSAHTLQRTIPFLCLVDFDPFGLEILAIYKYGSHNMALNNEFLVVSRLKWLGIHIDDFSLDDPAVMPLTISDTRKLEDLHSRASFHDVNEAQGWREQIVAMKHAEKKAEIEVLSDRAGGLSRQIRKKVEAHDWL